MKGKKILITTFTSERVILRPAASGQNEGRCSLCGSDLAKGCYPLLTDKSEDGSGPNDRNGTDPSKCVEPKTKQGE